VRSPKRSLLAAAVVALAPVALPTPTSGAAPPPVVAAHARAGGPLEASDPAELAARVGDDLVVQAWHVAPRATVEPQRVAELVDRLANRGLDWGVVVLDERPSVGTKVFGRVLRDRVTGEASTIDTVVVTTPLDITAASVRFDDETMDAALQAALPSFNADVLLGVEDLAFQLAGTTPAPSGSGVNRLDTWATIVTVLGALGVGAATVLMGLTLRERRRARRNGVPG